MRAIESPAQEVLDTIERLEVQKQARMGELRAKKPLLTQLLGLHFSVSTKRSRRPSRSRMP
eukprot:8370299-Pyramimonas_sp.AAC.1